MALCYVSNFPKWQNKFRKKKSLEIKENEVVNFMYI